MYGPMSVQLHQSPSLRGRRKSGAFKNAIGRSRGGQTTKIHALTDGRPLAFLITPGNTHYLVGARALISMVRSPRRLLADRAYGARSLRDELAARRINAVIPPNPTESTRIATIRPPTEAATSSSGCSAVSKTSAGSQPDTTSAQTSFYLQSS